MKIINKFIAMTLLLLSVVACQDISTDLEVPNVENPNDEILSTDPVALEATAGNIMNSWFMTVHNGSGPGAVFATMADVSSCSWGNFGMRDLSSEPRVAFNNDASYSNDVTNSYFNALYSLLTDANTIVDAVEKGTEFTDNNMVMAMAKFGQALSIGYLSLVFDKVWVYDAKGTVGKEEGKPMDYKEAMEYALKKLDEAIAIAEKNSFSLPDTWIPATSVSSADLAKFMNSMGARMLVGNVRNSSQKATIDWARVLKYANKGVTSDFEIYMDDETWYDMVPKTYLVYPGWGRADMRVINLMDSSMPNYWTDQTVVPESKYGVGVDQRLKTDFQYLDGQNFRPARGTYHFSNYRYSRYDSYIKNWKENVVEFSKAENDMYKAEALANTGDLSGAAAIINAGTRVTRGKLAEVAPNLEAITKSISHERFIEFAYTGMGLTFFEMRKENLLQEGTLLHFPVPGKALASAQLPYYTFGGTDGKPGEDYSNTKGWRK